MTFRSIIEKDNLTYYDNVSIKESFQLGYDDLGFICDQMTRLINQLL